MSYYNFSDLAIDDIEQICDFLAQTNPKFASQLFDTIRQKCKLVANFPNMGKDYSWIDSNLRGLIVDDYITRCATKNDRIRVLDDNLMVLISESLANQDQKTSCTSRYIIFYYPREEGISIAREFTDD